MKKKILYGIGALALIGVVAFGLSFALKEDTSLLRNQKVDGLSFENAKIDYKDEKSTFTVIVYNENKDTYDMESISFVFKDNENKEVELVSEMEAPLQSDEGRLLTVSVDKDITDMKSLEYKINK